LRIINKTLSNDRPIIVTYDNDDDGQRIVSKICDEDYNQKLITFFKIPQEPRVRYKSGHIGGSFEEIFDYNYFIDCCFMSNIMDIELVQEKDSFFKIFDAQKPWFQQVQKFCAEHNYYKFNEKKLSIAENLAIYCDKLPSTVKELRDLIYEVRDNNPVIHPDDVELPKIPGLTC